MVPRLPSDVPKDRQVNMLASVKIDSTSASCPAGPDHRLVSQASNIIGACPDENSSITEMLFFNVDDFFNTIERHSDNLSDSNGRLNGEQFMNLAEVSHGDCLRGSNFNDEEFSDTQDTQFKVFLISDEHPQIIHGIDDIEQIEDMRQIEMDGNTEQAEAAVPTAIAESVSNERSLSRKRTYESSNELADPTLASMFYPGNACLEPLTKKVRIVESAGHAYLQWFSSTDTSVQHEAASDMLEVLKLPKDNAFASWVTFNTEKSTDKKDDSAIMSEAGLGGYDYEMSPSHNSESSDYDTYLMSNSDDYLSSGPPSEDEIDVVSVPSAREPLVEDQSSWDILPASTHMSGHVADLHNYSSRPAHHPTVAPRCLAPVGSASAPPSPIQRIAPPPAKRCVSNPASPLQRVPAKYRKRRGTHDGGRGRGSRVKVDKDCMKRAQHNVLERERRLQLTQQFTVLRVQIPNIRNNERASKSDILNGARSYILKLKQHRVELDETLDRENRINAQLRKTFNETIRPQKSSKKGQWTM